MAGFRLKQTVLGMGNYISGQTSAVLTGTIVLSGSQVIDATLRVQLTAIKVSGKTQPQFGASLGTGQHPVATFALLAPVALSRAFATGGTTTVRATAACDERDHAPGSRHSLSTPNGAVLQAAEEPFRSVSPAAGTFSNRQAAFDWLPRLARQSR